jgi:presequence protease
MHVSIVFAADPVLCPQRLQGADMSEVPGYTLVRDEMIEELQTRARLYRHPASGAEILSLENDDENKSFGITFRTPPSDSTGIAHILEHAVLCGSRKYPVKDPFFVLVKSSVNTFLNAMTYPDKTTYPVASTNLKDFYNLVDVYLDAVFFPRLTPDVLRQEGWHIALDTAESAPQLRGVVYNEMKGAYSSADSLAYRYSQQSLFPATTYGHASGGDPLAIPDLTWQQFADFHQTHYHPSNARIFFYGDDPPARRLELLAPVLDQFAARPPASQIARQPRFSAPQTVEFSYQSEDADGRRGFVTVNWLVSGDIGSEQLLERELLSYLLLGNSAAALRKALIDSGLGDDVIGGGYNDGLLEHFFSVGMKGIDPQRAAEVEALILTTLAQLAADGFSAEAIEAALNTFEFSLRENNTGSFPRGLNLMLRTLGSWLYDADPYDALRFEAPLAAIRARLAAGEALFQPLIRQLLLENPHRTCVTLRPDPAKAARDAAAEQARLDAFSAALTDERRAETVAATQALQLRQQTPDTPEALATIPTLRLSDLERDVRTLPKQVETLHAAELLRHDIFTNGIVYLDLLFEARSLPVRLLPYLPLYARALTELGTERLDYVQLLQEIGSRTGGIGASPLTATHIVSREPIGRLLIRAKAVRARTADLLRILSDILLGLQLDQPDRWRRLVQRSRAGRESSLVPGGNAFARRRLAAAVNPADWAEELMNGVESIFFLRELERRIDQDWPAVLADLQLVHQTIVNRQGLTVNLTVDAAAQQLVLPELAAFLAGLPAAPAELQLWQTLAAPAAQGLIIPAQVNYVARGVHLPTYGLHPDASAAAVMRHVNINYLLEKIRIQGGAYGAGGGYDRSSGLFALTSYRDPHLSRTLDVYAGLADFLRHEHPDTQTVERVAIGALGDLDPHQLPDARGFSSLMRHISGVTDAYRQRIRDEVFATSPASFAALAPAADLLQQAGRIAVVGSEPTLRAFAEQQPDLELIRVL